jgi:hypothetical protein
MDNLFTWKAERENTKGGIVYDSAMAERTNNEEYSG